MTIDYHVNGSRQCTVISLTELHSDVKLSYFAVLIAKFDLNYALITRQSITEGKLLEMKIRVAQSSTTPYP